MLVVFKSDLGQVQNDFATLNFQLLSITTHKRKWTLKEAVNKVLAFFTLRKLAGKVFQIKADGLKSDLTTN